MRAWPHSLCYVFRCHNCVQRSPDLQVHGIQCFDTVHSQCSRGGCYLLHDVCSKDTVMNSLKDQRAFQALRNSKWFDRWARPAAQQWTSAASAISQNTFVYRRGTNESRQGQVSPEVPPLLYHPYAARKRCSSLGSPSKNKCVTIGKRCN